MAPDLAEIVDAWPELPEAIKAGILAMIRVRVPDTPSPEWIAPLGGDGAGNSRRTFFLSYVRDRAGSHSPANGRSDGASRTLMRPVRPNGALVNEGIDR